MRRNLTSDQQRQLDQQTCVPGIGALVANVAQAGAIRRQDWVDPALADVDAILASTANDDALDLEVAYTPDFPRNVTAAIAASTAAHVDAVQVIITGTDINDQPLTETLPAFTDDTPGSVAGSKAFKTVTRIEAPGHGGASALLTVGFGDKLGLDRVLFRNSVLQATADGVRETTFPTVAFDADEIASNTIDFNTALNGARDFAAWFIEERD